MAAETGEQIWDVAVVGGGPAGLSAAREAARAGARVVVLERAVHPRYKTCGGGLVGASLRAVSAHIDVPSRAEISAVTFTMRGTRPLTRSSPPGDKPILRMVDRAEFDSALRAAALAAGAHIRERTAVRGLAEHADGVDVRLSGGGTLRARYVIGADGTSGVTGRHVGVTLGGVDLGLEVELPVGTAVAARWRDRLLLDWGHLPGSYGWVFPKGDALTVGVIASKGHAEATRAYLRGFLHRLGLDRIVPARDSGHLTRWRTPGSPLRTARVAVAGDAAGLLEPWTREGISFAARSGALAGAAAAGKDLDAYVSGVAATLLPEMAAGAQLLAVFEAHPRLFHTAVRTRLGWAAFTRLCRGDTTFAAVMGHAGLRRAVAALSA